MDSHTTSSFLNNRTTTSELAARPVQQQRRSQSQTMNKYPGYLTNEPKPLVFIVGAVDNEPDVHSKIIRVIESNIRDVDSKDQPVISFRSVVNDHVFVEKKLNKDLLSTEGILKYNWPAKHFDLIPSVVILSVAFSVDWGLSEWQRREYLIQDKYNKLKATLSARDIKLVVIAVKVGAASLEKDAVDERISSLKRHLQVDSKSFACVSPSELTPENSYMKKISKSVRESSFAYYTGRIKHLKAVLKSISEKYKPGAIESMLHARYNFKVAFFYEFQGQAAQSLKYYRQCYQALSLSIETIDEELFEQVKTVAEMAHFKISNMLLYSTSVIEAFQQFKTHMTRFSKLYSEHPWKHYAWVSDQYVVFTQLLELYAVNDSLPDADRAYYYHNAARFSQKRQVSFEKMRAEMDVAKRGRTSSSSSVSATGRELFKGMILMPPRFIGSSAQVLDPVLDQLQTGTEDAQRLFSEYSLEQEFKVDHGCIVMGLLSLALERINPNFKRRKGFILSLIAEQNIKEENFGLALRNLCTASELLTSEGWVAPSVAVLGLIMKCAVLLGRPVEFLNAALTLYANASSLFLSRYEVEDLHLNVMSLLEATLANPHSHCHEKPDIPRDCFEHRKLVVHNRSAFLTSSFAALVDKPEYGSAPSEDRPVEYSLDAAHSTVDMSLIKKMFLVDVWFESAAVELGQKLRVRLTLTSKFMDDVAFDEMRVHFTDDSIVKRFVASAAADASALDDMGGEEASGFSGESEMGGGDFLLRRLQSSEDIVTQFGSTNKDVIRAPLLFAPNKPVSFEFDIYISEVGFASFLSPDAILCLERVELILTAAAGSSNEEVLLGDESDLISAINVDPPRQVIFDVAAFPDALLKARKGPGKPVTLRDVIRYCFNEAFPTITIQKPSALVSLLKPAANRPITLLQGVLQRVNVYLKVGACDMLDGCVFLASDYTPSREEDALFYYPDRLQLGDALRCADGETVSDERLDEVSFHSLLLNDSMQPAVPLTLGSVCTAGSVLFVPLFVCSHVAGSVNIKLRVEYVPRGRLKSSLSKEFVLQTHFMKALDMSFSVASTGATHDNHSPTVFSDECNLLTSSLHCQSSLQHTIGVSQLHIHLNQTPTSDGQPALSLLTGHDSEHTAAIIAAQPGSERFPVLLRGMECFEETTSFLCRQPDAPSSSAGKEPAAVSLGTARVHWRLMKKHVLRHTHAADSMLLHSTNWLPRFRPGVSSQSSDVDDSESEPLSRNRAIHAVSVSEFKIPLIKVSVSPFVVDIDVPPISLLGEVLQVRVTVRSGLSSSERLKLAVTLNENFLVSGSTLTTFEVPCGASISSTLSIVPLRCGSVPLPQISLTWDRAGLPPVKVLETRNSGAFATGVQQDLKEVFIRPRIIV